MIIVVFSQAEPNDSISPLNMVFAVIFVHPYFAVLIILFHF